MAGQRGYKTKLARLVAFLVLVCLAIGLVRRVTLSLYHSSSSPPHPSWSIHLGPAQHNLDTDPSALRPDRVHGRWAAVRASLGLPPLSHEVVFTPPDRRASRFDLGRKRKAEEARRLPQLHFAPDT